MRGCTLSKCKLNGLLVRDGAAPAVSSNVFDSNGLFGAQLVDCGGTLDGSSNTFRGNGKGAIKGECDREV